MKKSLSAVALAAAIVAIGAGPAIAGGYPPVTSCAIVNDSNVVVGETITLSGGAGCMLANESITVELSLATELQAGSPAALGSRAVPTTIGIALAPQTLLIAAGADGAYSVPLTFTKPGVYSVLVSGDQSGKTAGPITVYVADPTSDHTAKTVGGALADTGSDASLLLMGAAGIGVLGLGAGTVILVRGRSSASS